MSIRISNAELTIENERFRLNKMEGNLSFSMSGLTLYKKLIFNFSVSSYVSDRSLTFFVRPERQIALFYRAIWVNSTFLITADKKVAPHVNLIFVVGSEILDQTNNTSDLIGRGVTVRNFRNLQANTTTLIPNNYNNWQYRLVGFFSNLTASYKDWATKWRRGSNS